MIETLANNTLKERQGDGVFNLHCGSPTLLQLNINKAQKFAALHSHRSFGEQNRKEDLINMKNILIISLLMSFNSVIYCQNTEITKSPITESFPTFNKKSSSSGLYIFFKENIIYPEYAYKNKISGKVYVSFTVDANKWVKNHITNVHVIRSIHPSLDFAAISMVLGIPDKWDAPPRGIYDTVRFVYPIEFDLEKVKPEQISDCYDQKIKELLTMDSTELHSILYKDKPVERELYVLPPLANNNQKSEAIPASKRIEISGTILDFQDQSPMPGVEIWELGTTNATISNYDGEFSLSINKKAEVTISFPGYVPQTLKFKRSKLDLKIILNNESSIY